MIIAFRQIASNIAQRFEIAASDGYHYGELGRFLRSQPLTLLKNDGIAYKAKIIPLSEDTQDCFVMYQNGEEMAVFARNRTGIVKNQYVMRVGETSYDAYCYSTGSPSYFSVYDGNKQIALLETPLETTAFRYAHTLYLLDEYAELQDEMMMFVLYYCNYAFTHRFHMSFKEQTEKRYIYGKAFDFEWKNHHFS